MKHLIVLLLTLLSISGFSQIKIKTSKEYWYYENKLGFKRWKSQLKDFTVYDKKGNEIEWGTYGENHGWSRVDSSKDGTISVTCYDYWDYKKISFVDYYSYNTINQLVKTETWFFKDGKKAFLSGYVLCTYNKLGLIEKELKYDSEENRISETTTHLYDNKGNNVETIDSSFNSQKSYRPEVSIHRVINTFDSINRKSFAIEFSNGEFLTKNSFLYRDGKDVITELRYDNNRDTSLWSISEVKYGYTDFYCYGGPKLLEKFWKVINSPTETRDYYIYNKKCELQKILHYDGTKLTGFTKFNYSYY